MKNSYNPLRRRQNKKQNPVLKWAKDVTRVFTKEVSKNNMINAQHL